MFIRIDLLLFLQAHYQSYNLFRSIWWFLWCFCKKFIVICVSFVSLLYAFFFDFARIPFQRGSNAQFVQVIPTWIAPPSGRVIPKWGGAHSVLESAHGSTPAGIPYALLSIAEEAFLILHHIEAHRSRKQSCRFFAIVLYQNKITIIEPTYTWP